jgi:hypothetical protein
MMSTQFSRRCRAVVVTNDGKRFQTRWLRDKNLNDLLPDEFPPMHKSLRAAQRLVERKGLDVKRIDGQFTLLPTRRLTP